VSCGSGCLVKSDRNGFEVLACRCRSWKCKSCGPQRRRTVRDEILSGAPNVFLTLTWNGRRNEPPAAARAIMGRAWKHLVARIRRRWPGREFEYFAVVEQTKRGYPHFHIAIRGSFMPQRWLSDAWADLVGAPVVDIRAPRSREGLASYLAKYLAKDPQKLGSGKRYWCSQGYRRRDASGRPADRPVARWHWENDHIIAVVVKLAGRNLFPHWIKPDHCVIRQGFDP